MKDYLKRDWTGNNGWRDIGDNDNRMHDKIVVCVSGVQCDGNCAGL